MRFLNRQAALVIVFGLALGCGKDTPEAKKPFDGEMPTSGSAELTVGIPMS
jgi:hypothetical protein